MSIQRRLALSITLVLVFSLAVGAGLTYQHAVRKVRTEVQAALTVAAFGAVNTLNKEQARDDATQAPLRIVRDFDGDRHVRATYYGGGGQVVARSSPLVPDAKAPQWFERMVIPTIPQRSIPMPGAAAAGRIVLEAEPLNEVSEAWSDAGLTLGIMALFFAAVLVLAYTTIRSALQPLRDVCSALASIGRGDLSVRVGPRIAQELLPLRDGFNLMAERLAEADKQNRILNDQIINLQDEERAELARDLHDDVAPFVFAVGADAAVIRQYLAKGASLDELTARADSIAEAVRHMQRHLKGVLRRLAPGALLELGLSGAIDNLIAFWSTRRPNVQIEASVDGESLDPPLDAIAFRCVQEAVSNALRHGEPTHIAIRLSVGEDAAMVSVADDGKGLPASRAGYGFGLTGMNERVRSVGGQLTVTSGPAGKGVAVQAVLPLRPGAAGTDATCSPMEMMA